MSQVISSSNVTMDDVISSFQVSPSKLKGILKETGGVVAGSAPLAALVGGFTPNDLDIWVYPGPHNKQYGISGSVLYSDEAFQNYLKFKDLFNNYFDENDYKLIVQYTKPGYSPRIPEEYKHMFAWHTSSKLRDVDGYDALETREGDVIKRIHRYYLKDDTEYSGRSIQVIYTKVPIMDAINSFDLSVCRTWWDGEALHTSDPESTLAKQMYKIRPSATPREEERVKKYEERGFRLRSS